VPVHIPLIGLLGRDDFVVCLIGQALRGGKVWMPSFLKAANTDPVVAEMNWGIEGLS
jgi:hypothetical protein